MKRFICLIPIVLLLVFLGCSEDETECPDVNETNIDPPFIQSITSPGDITVGESGDFSCSVVSDAQIERYSWNTMPISDIGASYYFPDAGSSEGGWTPSGTRPDLFNADYSGNSISTVYDYRGVYAAVLEIEDEDEYIERAGTIVRVNPTQPDTSINPDSLFTDDEYTLQGADMEFLQFGLSASDGSPAAAYAYSPDTLKCFGYIDGSMCTGEKYIYSYAQTGDIITLCDDKFTDTYMNVNFHIKGAMHIWNPQPTDYVTTSIYMIICRESGLPEIHCIFSHSLDGAYGEQAYYFDSTREVEVHTTIEIADYDIWFSVETEQNCSGNGGSAICFDGENGYVSLNSISVTFQPPW